MPSGFKNFCNNNSKSNPEYPKNKLSTWRSPDGRCKVCFRGTHGKCVCGSKRTYKLRAPAVVKRPRPPGARARPAPPAPPPSPLHDLHCAPARLCAADMHAAKPRLDLTCSRSFAVAARWGAIGGACVADRDDDDDDDDDDFRGDSAPGGKARAKQRSNRVFYSDDEDGDDDEEEMDEDEDAEEDESNESGGAGGVRARASGGAQASS